MVGERSDDKMEEEDEDDNNEVPSPLVDYFGNTSSTLGKRLRGAQEPASQMFVEPKVTEKKSSSKNKEASYTDSCTDSSAASSFQLDVLSSSSSLR